MSDRSAHAPKMASARSAPSASSVASNLSVVVLGMHRSGTSALAGVLHDAGVSAGPVDELVPPLPENPRFYGERPDVVGLNDRLFAALGWTWDAPAASPDPSPPRCDEFVAEGRQLAKALMDRPVDLIKDPRLSILLPWWRRMLLDRFVAVVPVRQPEEVAWSLSVRDGLPFELGLALWLAYHRHLAAGLDGLPAVVVDFDALTADPGPVVRKLLDELTRLGVRGALDADAAVAAVVPELRRSTQPSASDNVLAAEARRFAAAWLEGPVVAHERFSRTAAPPASWEVSLLDLQRRLRHESEAAGAAERALRDMQTTLDGLRQEAITAVEERRRAEAALAEARHTTTTALQTQARIEQAVDMARQEADALRIELRVAREDSDAAREEADAARREAGVARHEAGLARDEAELAHLGAAARANPFPMIERASVQRLPGVRHARRAARRFGDLLAIAPITSAFRRNPMFDPEWYLAEYPDVRASGMDPWRHYRRHGIAEGRDPNSWFHAARYLAENPDVRAAGMDPLEHYLRHGCSEGRGPGTAHGGQVTDRSRPEGSGRSTGDPPARSGLDGRSGFRSGRTTRSPSASETGRIARWLDGLVPDPVPEHAAVLVLGGAAANGRQKRTTLIPLPADGAATARGHLSDTSLIAQLEWQRSRHPTFLAIPARATGLLDQVPRFRQHIALRSAVVATAPDLGVLRDLSPASAPDRGALGTVQQLVESVRESVGGEPAVLDRTRSTVGERLAGVRLVIKDPDVPWPTGSVDIVLLDAGADPVSARHIATRAVVAMPTSMDGPPVVLHTQEGAAPTTGTISVVIPHYGPIEVLRTCLAAVRETTSDVTGLEVLVVDDATPGIDASELEALVTGTPGGRLLVNDTNLGFLGSANRGAAEAIGDLLLLLNNDTLVLPGWLLAVHRTFQQHPDAGVVGGRLVYPDGRLQEAGGLVFGDGSAAKLGYGDPDPDAPMYTFLRDTDYVSGALLATPRSLFESLGGFDPAFGFGFYEDTDYCFRVRQAGRRVLYQPESTVIHVEGGTAGTDTSVGPKRAQVANQDLFRDRWADILRSRPGRPRTVRPEDWYAAALATAAGTRAGP